MLPPCPLGLVNEMTLVGGSSLGRYKGSVHRVGVVYYVQLYLNTIPIVLYPST